MAHHARSKNIYLEQFTKEVFEEGGAGFKVRDRTSGRMKGRFEWWFVCLEGFKAPRSLELVVGNPNYGSPATSFASLAPLCVARPLFQYILATNLPLRWQFHRLHGKLLTGDMSRGMRWLFMAWGGGVLNAWWVGEGCSMPHCSFSPQCQCRHKSHEFLQRYVSEARKMQFIETKHT